jgi:hypothetical protein
MSTVDTTGVLADRALSFADAIADCTALLPDLVDAYGSDPERYAGMVDRVNHLESRCDSHARDLRRLLGGRLDPTFSAFYLVADELVAVLNDADDVASRTERFAKELQVLGPDLSRRERADLREMASLAAEAASVFVTALRAYVQRLDGDGEADVSYSLDRVRSLERDCDLLKYDLLSRAFEDGASAEALVRKDLVTSLDGVANATEDAADGLLGVASLDVD